MPKAKGETQTAILIADDHVAIGYLLVQLFAPDGFRVEVALNGPQALELARKTPFSLALLDVRLPGKPAGAELVMELHRLQPDITIVAMSALPESDEAEKVLKAGAIDIIGKPFNITDVKTLIMDLLRRNRSTKVKNDV